MRVTYSSFQFLVCSVLAAAVAGCGGGGADAGLPVQTERTAQFNPPGFVTSGPAEAQALPGSNLDLTPLLTVGDEVPLLTGKYPNLVPHPTKTFAVAGIPDGLGYFEANGYRWVWVNHEIERGTKCDFSKTIDGQLDGARVSLFKFNDDWECLGGTNLIDTIRDSSGIIGTVKLQGNKVSQSGRTFSRFCTANLSTLFDNGAPVFLPGEESDDGRGWAIYSDGNAVCVEDAQYCARENDVAIKQYGDAETVLVGLDDTRNRPLVLYVGNRTNKDHDGFKSGKSYVLNVEDAVGNFVQNTSGMAVGTPYAASWEEIPSQYYSSQADYYTWSAAADWRGTDFMRLEDGEENPNSLGDLYFVTTGSSGTYDVFGSLFKLEFDPADPLGPATLTMVTQGGPGSFISPDNVAIDDEGHLYAMEDVNGGQPVAQMAAENRNGSIWRMNLDGTGQQRIIQQDQTYFDGFNTAGDLLAHGISIWETSGIIEVDKGPGPASLLFDVQAHSVNDPADMNGGDYVQGGQLLLARPTN